MPRAGPRGRPSFISQATEKKAHIREIPYTRVLAEGS